MGALPSFNSFRLSLSNLAFVLRKIDLTTFRWRAIDGIHPWKLMHLHLGELYSLCKGIIINQLSPAINDHWVERCTLAENFLPLLGEIIINIDINIYINNNVFDKK